jgi:hypothetical protein
MLNLSENLQQLYEKDYLVWLEKNTQLLKNRQFQELDLDNLIEELEALGRSEKTTVETFLARTIQHLLLYHYWSEERERNGNHWLQEIGDFRLELEFKLTTNLKQHLTNNLDKIYLIACKFNRKKPNFNVSLPSKCPYTIDQILDVDWLPSINE